MLRGVFDERDKFEAFKEYVHRRLDAANVPHNPEPEANAKNGCRVEGRLNFLEKQLAAAKQDSNGWQRHWRDLDRERSSLKGRIASLRGGHRSLAGGNCLADVEEYKAASKNELEHDDARRRRFEAREKGRRG